MAWSSELLDASWRGVTFSCKNTRDRAERALVKYEYPFRNGGEVDDLGLRLRQMSFTAVFWGPDYESDLQDFIAALDDVDDDNQGEGELIHPVFGSIPAKLESYEISHDEESPDYAEVQLVFVESGLDNPFFDPAQSGMGAASGLISEALAGISEAISSAQAAVASWLDEARETLGFNDAMAMMGECQSLISSYSGAVDAALSGLSYLQFPSALASDLEAAVGKTASLANLDPSNLAGRFSGWQRLSGLFDRHSLTGGGLKAKKYPATTSAYVGSIISGTSGSLPGPRPGLASPPQSRPAYEPSPIPANSIGNGVALANAHANLLDTEAVIVGASDIFRAEAAAPSLSPAEIETIAGDARERIKDSLAEVRSVFPEGRRHAITQGLRDSALAIQDLAAALIIRRPPLVTHSPAYPCNFHLLAHRLYKDYARASELKRLNPSVRCPNFIAAGQEVSGYAR